MRLSPVHVFVASTLVVVATLAYFASRERATSQEATALPSDTARFGFVVRTTERVPLLEATRPFVLPLANGPVHGRPPSPEHFAAGSATITRELARYSPKLLRATRLAGIVLVEGLAENETEIPSLPNVGGLLLLDVSSVESDLVRALHHEVFHFFDLADDGAVSPDPELSALNPPGFAYGSGGRTMREAWAARATTTLPGFVSAYATSGVEEDKAETFALAVARAAFVRERLTTDAVLRAKLALLARRLAAFDEEAPRTLGLDALLATVALPPQASTPRQ